MSRIKEHVVNINPTTVSGAAGTDLSTRSGICAEIIWVGPLGSSDCNAADVTGPGETLEMSCDAAVLKVQVRIQDGIAGILLSIKDK